MWIGTCNVFLFFDGASVSVYCFCAHAADSTPPTVSSAVVEDGARTSIVLTFSETPVVASALSATDFEIVVDSGTAVSPSAASIDGDTIVLTAATAIGNGNVVTVSYTASGTSEQKIKDAAGNSVATFAGQAVTNNVAAGGTCIPLPPLPCAL